MDNTVFSVGDIASVLAGAGISRLSGDLTIGLILIGSAVALKIIVAVLNRYDIPVTAKQLHVPTPDRNR